MKWVAGLALAVVLIYEVFYILEHFKQHKIALAFWKIKAISKKKEQKMVREI